MNRDLVMLSSLSCGVVPTLGSLLDPALTTPPGEDDHTTAKEDLIAMIDYYGEEHTFNAPEAFSGWPAAVSVRPANWNLDPQPAQYTIAAGDTLAGLAATYLGDPARVMEIWMLQDQQYRWSHSADTIFPGEVFAMPDEARDNFINWIKQGKPTTTLPGKLPPETLAQKGKRLWPVAVVGVGAVGLAYYLIKA
jgi:hypothetical protein